MEELCSPDEKIGEFLIRIGAMNKEQFNEVMTAQEKEPDKLFGQIAIEKGYVNDEAINKYLEHKCK